MKARLINANLANKAMQASLIRELATLMSPTEEKGEEDTSPTIILAIQEGRLSAITKQLADLCTSAGYNAPSIHFMRTVTKASEVLHTSGLITAVLTPRHKAFVLKSTENVRGTSYPHQRANKGGLVVSGAIIDGKKQTPINVVNVHLESNTATKRLTDVINLHKACAPKYPYRTVAEFGENLSRIVMGDFNTRRLAIADGASLSGYVNGTGLFDAPIEAPSSDLMRLPLDAFGCPVLTMPETPTYHKGTGLDKKRKGFHKHGVLDYQLSNVAVVASASSHSHVVAAERTAGYDHAAVVSAELNLQSFDTAEKVRNEILRMFTQMMPNDHFLLRGLRELDMTTAEGLEQLSEIYYQSMREDGHIHHCMTQHMKHCKLYEASYDSKRAAPAPSRKPTALSSPVSAASTAASLFSIETPSPSLATPTHASAAETKSVVSTAAPADTGASDHTAPPLR